MTTAPARGKQPDSVADDDQETVYRDGYKALTRLIWLLTFVMVAGGGFLAYYLDTYIRQDRYIAVTESGQTMQMTGLLEPNINTEFLAQWAALAASDVMTFGFNDIDARFAVSRKYFTAEGWDSFREAMAKSGFLRDITTYQQIVTAIPTTPPIEKMSGMDAGKFTWVMEVPLAVTIRAGGQVARRSARVTMYIVRVPTSENPTGIGIRLWRI